MRNQHHGNGGDMPKRDVRNIFVMTGSGISAESGIQLYRSDTGLWANHKVEEVATVEALIHNPDKVIGFCDERYAEVSKAEPNPAHDALFRLSQIEGVNMTIVTQNVDLLHERAGSENVIHIHGDLATVVCASCGKQADGRENTLSASPCDACGGRLRRDVVLFGEMPKKLDLIEEDFLNAGTYISIGTSGEVWPAAGYAKRARNRKLNTIEVNPRQTELSHFFDVKYRGLAGTEVPRMVDNLIREISSEPDPSP